MRGVPVRIEIGPRDVDGKTAVLVRRDRAKDDPDQKRSVSHSTLSPANCRLSSKTIQRSLFEQAKAFLDSHTIRVTDRAEFFETCRDRAGMIDIAWCRRPQCEAHVKDETGATTRNLRPLEGGETACVACGEPAIVRAYFAQSY